MICSRPWPSRRGDTTAVALAAGVGERAGQLRCAQSSWTRTSPQSVDNAGVSGWMSKEAKAQPLGRLLAVGDPCRHHWVSAMVVASGVSAACGSRFSGCRYVGWLLSIPSLRSESLAALRRGHPRPAQCAITARRFRSRQLLALCRRMGLQPSGISHQHAAMEQQRLVSPNRWGGMGILCRRTCDAQC